MGQGQRLELQTLLEGLSGSPSVYFQPPPDKQMSYPAIVYERDFISTFHADNKPYKNTQGYQLTIIDRDPDSPLIDQVAALPLCQFSRHFATSGLNHDVFVIYH